MDLQSSELIASEMILRGLGPGAHLASAGGEDPAVQGPPSGVLQAAGRPAAYM